MKKQPNVDVIANELRGNSAFFPRYKEKPSVESGAHQTVGTPLPPPASTADPVPPVRVVPPVPPVRTGRVSASSSPKRVMNERHPFDIYQDQYEALQQLALEERKQGGVGSMSAMVREALDQLIATKKRGQQ